MKLRNKNNKDFWNFEVLPSLVAIAILVIGFGLAILVVFVLNS